MAQVEGFVTVYEASDGGSGDPRKTIWQFFVDAQPVATENRLIAETMRLAVKTDSRVRVEYDATNNTISQARIAFKYECEWRERRRCESGQPPNPDQPSEYICESRRISYCERDRNSG